MGLKERLQEKKEKIQNRVKHAWQRTRRYVRFGVYMAPDSSDHGDQKDHDAHHVSHANKENHQAAHGVPEFVDEYTFLRKNIQELQRPIRISNPACGYDISLSKVFTDSEIYYLDPNPDVIAGLQEAKKHGKLHAGAHIMPYSGLAFNPIAVDMVVLRNVSTNPAVRQKEDSAKLLKTLRPDGLVVVSDTSGLIGARYLSQMSDMELCGRFVHEDHRVRVDESDLSNLKAQIAHTSDSDHGGLSGATFLFRKISQGARNAPSHAA